MKSSINFIRLFSLTLLLAITSQAVAQEIPAAARGGGSVCGGKGGMIVITDVPQMSAVMEHPEFDPTALNVIDTTLKLPSVMVTVVAGNNEFAPLMNVRPMGSEIYRTQWIEFRQSFASPTINNPKMWGEGVSSNALDTLFSLGWAKPTGNQSSDWATITWYHDSSKTLADLHALVSSNDVNVNSAFMREGNSNSGSPVYDNHGARILNLAYTTHDVFNEDLYSLPNGLAATRSRVFAVRGQADHTYRHTPMAQDYKLWVNTANGGSGGMVSIKLPTGLYREEYLRWLYYHATPEQRAWVEDHGHSRFITLKSVLKEILNENPNFIKGIAIANRWKTFNQQTPSFWGSVLDYGHEGYGHYLVSRFDATAEADRAVIDTLSAGRSGLPHNTNDNNDATQNRIGTAYSFAMGVLFGKRGEYGSTSPIQSDADVTDIIIVSAAAPNKDDGLSITSSQWVGDLDGDGAEDTGTQADQSCPATGRAACQEFMDDVAWYGSNNPANPAVPNSQVKTRVVELGFHHPIYDRVASAGGTGAPVFAATRPALKSALLGGSGGAGGPVVSSIAGSSPTLIDRGNSATLIRSRFSADFWSGNVDIYEVNRATGALTFQRDVAEVWSQRNLKTSPRKLYASQDENFDGEAIDGLALNTSLSTEDLLKVHAALFRRYLVEGANPAGIASIFSAYSAGSDSEKETITKKLIDFFNGDLSSFTAAELSALRARDRGNDGGNPDLGDFVHSRPVYVPAQSGAYEDLDGYHTFISSQQSQREIFLIGGNDGMLHAFRVDNGEEVWAWMPAAALKFAELLSQPGYNLQLRRPFVDGEVSVRDVYLSGSWRKLALFGLRGGGTSYVVLDITDRENPNLIFEKSFASELGQSFSAPEVVVSGGIGSSPNNYDFSMVVGTGEGKATKGINLGVFKLADGLPAAAKFISLDSEVEIGTRTTSVVATQNDADINTDRIYLGSESGDLFRVQVKDDIDSWHVDKVYIGSKRKPITARPVAVLIDNPEYSGSNEERMAVGVYFGTGWYDDPLTFESRLDYEQTVVGLLDPVNTADDDLSGALVNIDPSDLEDQSDNALNAAPRSAGGGGEAFQIPSDKKGFRFKLPKDVSISNNFIRPSGMVVSEGTNLRGAILMPLFAPPCGALCGDNVGESLMLAFDARTGGGVIMDASRSDRGVFYNGGVSDLDASNSVDATDLQMGISDGILSPMLDAKISGEGRNVRRIGNGSLLAEDVELLSGGAVRPQVISFGKLGYPHTPQLLLTAKSAFVQSSHIDTPRRGQITTGLGSAATAYHSNKAAQPLSSIIRPLDILPVILSTQQVSDR
jgi:type IV pilus assembly protein PilY1